MTLKQVAEKYGLTQDGVDYALNQYGIVISEITHGLLSKLTYDAYDVIQCAQERWCETCELAKAQEPRVLSFAEAMLDTDRDVIWVEFKDDPIVEAAIPGFAVNEYADAYCVGFDSEDGTIRLSAYQCGKIWRPWSLRPTDEQREAIPWNAQK